MIVTRAKRHRKDAQPRRRKRGIGKNATKAKRYIRLDSISAFFNIPRKKACQTEISDVSSISVNGRSLLSVDSGSSDAPQAQLVESTVDIYTHDTQMRATLVKIYDVSAKIDAESFATALRQTASHSKCKDGQGNSLNLAQS